MNFLITEKERNALLEYLSQRPWREVYQAMTALQNLPPVETDDDRSTRTEGNARG
jgi:hypothetical protein